jgi:hypothetical protein
MEPAAECMLVLIGATPEGKKELVGFQTGARESAQSWRELLIDIKQRGLEIAPDLAVGDGALGFWKAIEEVFPGARHQRCWVHKTANVLNKVALSVQINMKADLREIYGAPTRYCPKCQGAAAKDWLAAREADLLPIGYFHLVFTLPAEIAPIAYQNKAVVYDLLFRTAAQTLLTIAADPKYLSARTGATAVLHTWGSSPHDRAGRRDIVRWHALGALPTLLPVTSAGAVPPVPASLPGWARRRPCSGPAGVLRRTRRPASPTGFRRAPRATQEEEMVRLRQAALH